MSKLTFTCHEETNEVSPSDSPYFLVYVGDAQKQISVVERVRRESWDDNIDAGNSRAANVTFPGITHFDLVLIALLEEDWDPDFDSVTLAQLRHWMKQNDSLLQPGTIHTPSTFNIFRQEFTKAINTHSSNDDLLGVLRFPGNSTKHFFGGGGHYEVKFEVN
jgi:hypothetical protein